MVVFFMMITSHEEKSYQLKLRHTYIKNKMVRLSKDYVVYRRRRAISVSDYNYFKHLCRHIELSLVFLEEEFLEIQQSIINMGLLYEK